MLILLRLKSCEIELEELRNVLQVKQQKPLQLDKYTQFDSLLDEFDDYKEEKEVELERIRREKNSLAAELDRLREEKTRMDEKRNIADEGVKIDESDYVGLKEECEKLKEKLTMVEKVNAKLKNKLKQLLKEQNKSSKAAGLEGEDESGVGANQDEANTNENGTTELIGKIL